MENRSVNKSDVLNRIIRAVILIVVSLLLSIISVSFAVHHMRLQFESEYKAITDNKIKQVCELVKITINGDEVVGDPVYSASKYKDVFDLMLTETSTQSFSEESYAFFLYSDGHLSLLLSHGTDNAESFAVAGREISDWLSADNSIAILGGENTESVLVPVADSSGRCVGVFEYKVSFDKLSNLGNTIEARVLTSVIIAVVAGIILFMLQLFIPRLLTKSSKGGQRL